TPPAYSPASETTNIPTVPASYSMPDVTDISSIARRRLADELSGMNALPTGISSSTSGNYAFVMAEPKSESHLVIPDVEIPDSISEPEAIIESDPVIEPEVIIPEPVVEPEPETAPDAARPEVSSATSPEPVIRNTPSSARPESNGPAWGLKRRPSIRTEQPRQQEKASSKKSSKGKVRSKRQKSRKSSKSTKGKDSRKIRTQSGWMNRPAFGRGNWRSNRK
ncbi:MAG: hypothetical protein QF886_23670, partial [Planctomycetota bacterium]|nr:hypothetical protein [Planctomycetota bacterium]